VRELLSQVALEYARHQSIDGAADCGNLLKNRTAIGTFLQDAFQGLATDGAVHGSSDGIGDYPARAGAVLIVGVAKPMFSGTFPT
jgi:hypothetical protein